MQYKTNYQIFRIFDFYLQIVPDTLEISKSKNLVVGSSYCITASDAQTAVEWSFCAHLHLYHLY